jgi:hypothetical protein
MAMSEPLVTNTPSIEDVLDFNALLGSLHRAGIPLYLKGSHGDVRGTTDVIDRAVAIRHGRGESLGSIMEDPTLISKEYRQALVDWVASDRNATSIEPLVRMGNWSQRQRRKLALSASQLWILWVLASATLLLMVANLTPKIRELYRVSDLNPGHAYHFLEWIYDSWLVWAIAALAFAIVAWLGWQWRSRWANFAWIPFRSKILDSTCKSAVASNLSKTYPGMEAGETESSPFSSSSMRWAREQQPSSDPSKGSFSLIARLFQRDTLRRSRVGLQWIPTAASALLGGAIVLALGLALFLPMIELLVAYCLP